MCYYDNTFPKRFQAENLSHSVLQGGFFILRPADSTGLIPGVDCLIPGAYMDKILRVLDRAAVGVVELHRLRVQRPGGVAMVLTCITKYDIF